MPPHQDVELVTGSYGTRCDAELARGVLHFHPWPAYVSGGESYSVWFGFGRLEGLG